MRTLKWVALALVLLALAAVVTFATTNAPKVGRLALRIACPTVFIEGRSVSYAMDKLRHLGLLPADVSPFVSVSIDQARHTAQSRVLGLFKNNAMYYQGEGCVLVD